MSPPSGDPIMDGTHAARRWADVWRRGWEARDLESVVALYSSDALLSSQAFRKPYLGRDGVRTYVAQAFDEEREVRASMGVPIVSGDRAAIEWWAALVENDREITLAGVSMIRFDAKGLVIEQRDSWNQTDGRREPAPGWGR